jgi:hypothetical protein
MYPYRSHYNIGRGIRRAHKRLRRCPDVMGKIRGAIGIIVCIEEEDGKGKDDSGCNRDQEGDDRMAGCSLTISREGMSKGVLMVKNRRFGGASKRIEQVPNHCRWARVACLPSKDNQRGPYGSHLDWSVMRSVLSVRSYPPWWEVVSIPVTRGHADADKEWLLGSWCNSGEGRAAVRRLRQTAAWSRKQHDSLREPRGGRGRVVQFEAAEGSEQCSQLWLLDG